MGPGEHKKTPNAQTMREKWDPVNKKTPKKTPKAQTNEGKVGPGEKKNTQCPDNEGKVGPSEHTEGAKGGKRPIK